MSEESTVSRNLFEAHKICVLIPTYNNSGTLQTVIEDVLAYTRDIIVVNDGSTDETATILQKYPQLKIVNHIKNSGKGVALRSGFKKAYADGFAYAITMDSDGQHFAKDLPAFIQKLETTGPALIIGARNMNQASVPGKSSFGNKFSNFWFYFETGIKIPDTQSGYRLYPLLLLNDLIFFTRKFEFEIEVIVRAAWKGIKVDTVPVSVFYAPSEERVTHFRPFRDFTRISLLNTVLVIITLLYIKPRNLVRAIFDRTTYSKLKQELFNRDETPSVTAISVAFGIFMGIAPVWGFQLLIAITVAIALRLNKALVILSANISIPPMIPVIIFFSYEMGSVWVGNTSSPLKLNNSITLESIHINFIQYLYGSITLAFLAALISGLLVYAGMHLYKRKKICLSHE